MTMQMCKRMTLLLLTVLMLGIFFGCSKAESEPSAMDTIHIINTSSDSLLRFEVGLIDGGENVDSSSGIRTIEYLPVDSVDSVEIAKGYKVRLFQYSFNDGTYTPLERETYDKSFLMQDAVGSRTQYIRLTVESVQTDQNTDEWISELLSRSGLSVKDKDGNIYINCIPGMMQASSGQIAVTRSHTLYTPQWIKLEKGTAIAVHHDYQLDWYAYQYSSDDDAYIFCGSSSKHITNGVFQSDDVLDQYPDATHIRLELTADDGTSAITYGAAKESEVAVFKDQNHYKDYKKGSIYSKNGSDNAERDDRFYTPDYLELDDVCAVTVNRGYKLIWFAYSGSKVQKTFVKASGWIAAGDYFTAEDIKRQCPDAKYFRFAVCGVKGFTAKTKSELSDAIRNSGVSIYTHQDAPAFNTGNIISDSESTGKKLPGEVVPSTKKITSSLISASYIDVDTVKTLSLHDDASVRMYLYDENNNYLGRTTDYVASAAIEMNYFKEDFPDMKYARFELKGASENLNFAKAEFSRQMISISTDEIPYSTFFSHINNDDAADKIRFAAVGEIKKLQDAAVYGDYLFDMGSPNMGYVYNVNTFEKIADVVLDKAISIHSNSVCFGTRKYNKKDDFPLLYCNVYNNYASEKDTKEGTCGVFRLMKDKKGNYTGKLVQLIRIGFVKDLSLWESTGDGKDFRPYGNFIVDTDHNRLYAYVMRDKEQIIRFFEFKCPAVKASDKYETVILNEGDIISTFDLDYYEALQGVTYHNGMIYSLEGFSQAKMHIIDLKRKRLHASVDLAAMGFAYEPEAVFANGDDIFFSNATGNVYQMITD